MATDSNGYPEFKRRLANLSVAVFVRSGKDSNSFRSAVLQCSYKNKDDQWVNPSVSMTETEINNAIRLLEVARSHMEIVSEAS